MSWHYGVKLSSPTLPAPQAHAELLLLSRCPRLCHPLLSRRCCWRELLSRPALVAGRQGCCGAPFRVRDGRPPSTAHATARVSSTNLLHVWGAARRPQQETTAENKQRHSRFPGQHRRRLKSLDRLTHAMSRPCFSASISITIARACLPSTDTRRTHAWQQQTHLVVLGCHLPQQLPLMASILAGGPVKLLSQVGDGCGPRGW